MPDFDKVQIKVTKVAGAVYLLEGLGGNIGVSIGEDGIVLVDDQFAPLAPKIEAALKSLSSKPLRFVINTHFHGDHSGGNAHFGKGATLIAHENARKRILEHGTTMGKKEPPAKTAVPVITFDERLSVWLNGEEIRAVHLPHGHTDGDAVIYFTGSNVVHMGDDFFNGRFPFIDLENGGSLEGLIADDEQVLAKLGPEVKVIPGHGPLSDAKGLRAFVEMLKATSGAVRAAVKAGKSLDQLKKEKLLAKWDSWGWDFISADDYLEVLYQDATRKRP